MQSSSLPKCQPPRALHTMSIRVAFPPNVHTSSPFLIMNGGLMNVSR